MKNLIIVLLVAAMLVAPGCFNVEVPEGPYVNLNGDGSGAGGGTVDRKTVDRRAYDKIKDILDDAREDGVITSSQQKELMKRTEKELDAR